MALENKKYLDLEGLTKYDAKIKAKIAAEDAKKVDKVSGTSAQELGAYKVAVDAQGLVVGTANLSYNDLSDKPTIGNGKLTIQANGTDKGTFTANQTGDTTVNITAEDLGITQVLKFIGAATETAPTAGKYVRADVTYLGTEYTLYIPQTTEGTLEEVAAAVGNVFIITDYAWEVLCTKGGMHGVSEWVSLGDESDFARKTTTITGSDGLTGGGDLSENRTISHATPEGATVHTKGLYKIATDKFGHVTVADDAITVSTAADHTHTFEGTATVTIPTVTPTSGKLKLTSSTVSVMTDVNSSSSKLVTSTVTGVSGSTTASKATAATPVVYGLADVGTAVKYGTANVGASVTYGTANAGEEVIYGNANVGGAIIAGQADVGTAVVYGKANVGSTVTIIPAKANGTASKAQAGTAIVYGTADVGEQITYGNANVGPTITVITGITGTTTFATNFADSKQAFEAVYDSANLCLNLTPLTLSTASFTPASDSISPATASSETAFAAKAAATTQTFTPYTFTDVNVATVDTAVSFNQASAAPDTQTLTPAVAATRTITPAAESSTKIRGAVASTLTLTPATEAPDGQTLTPATAASGRSITPYTFADVTVPTAATIPTTVATGALSASGTGADVVIGVSVKSTTPVVNSVSIAKAADGTVDYVESVATGTSETSATISGNTGSAGSHTHTLS